MTVSITHSSRRSAVVPRPRPPQDDEPGPAPVGEFPWPEPWHFSRGARPRSEYWDVATASWHSRGPRI